MIIEQLMIVLLWSHLAAGQTTNRPIRHQHGVVDSVHKNRRLTPDAVTTFATNEWAGGFQSQLDPTEFNFKKFKWNFACHLHIQGNNIRGANSSDWMESEINSESVPVDVHIDDQSVERTHPVAALCRVNGHYLPVDLFSLDTCARCYTYIPDQPSFFHSGAKWNASVALMTVRDPFTDRDLVYNITHLSHNGTTVSWPIYSNFHLNWKGFRVALWWKCRI